MSGEFTRVPGGHNGFFFFFIYDFSFIFWENGEFILLFFLASYRSIIYYWSFYVLDINAAVPAAITTFFILFHFSFYLK